MKLYQTFPHLAALALFSTATAAPLNLVKDEEAETISVFRLGSSEPIIVQHAREDHRPYLHPIVAPDGNGVLTEYSPGHHKHQTGIYWGFTRLNGRDYFPQSIWWILAASRFQDTRGFWGSRPVGDCLSSVGRKWHGAA